MISSWIQWISSVMKYQFQLNGMLIHGSNDIYLENIYVSKMKMKLNPKITGSNLLGPQNVGVTYWFSWTLILGSNLLIQCFWVNFRVRPKFLGSK